MPPLDAGSGKSLKRAPPRGTDGHTVRVPRRQFLGASALAVLAGCLGDTDDDAGTTATRGTAATEAGSATNRTRPGTPSDAATATADETVPEGTTAETVEPGRGSEKTGAETGAETTEAGTEATDGEATDPETTRDGPADAGRARIGFTGDVMLGRSVDEYRDSRPPESLWGDLRSRLDALDGLFVNLETTISERGEKWPDRTYYFRADPDWSIPALRTGNVAWASLANNHLLDFGTAALLDTVSNLDRAGIANSGAGRDVEAAREPAHVTAGGVDVALVSFTDNSPGYAAESDRPGTAYVEMDVDDPSTRRIVRGALERARESDPDLLVASLHWGPNWVVRPDEQYVEFAHWLADEGVDLVHGHSAHVFQGVEVYGGTLILHDTGDFVDDYVVKEGLHNDRNFLFEVALDASGFAELRLLPVEIDVGVHRASEEAAAWARERMTELSAAFGTTFERDGAALVLPLDDA